MSKCIKELLKNIKKNPAIYIGKKSLERLSTFLSGYLYCMGEQQGIFIECLPGFQEYISEHYNIHSAHHWSSIILFYSSTEEEAFDKFYAFLDTYFGEGWDN